MKQPLRGRAGEDAADRAAVARPDDDERRALLHGKGVQSPGGRGVSDRARADVAGRLDAVAEPVERLLRILAQLVAARRVAEVAPGVVVGVGPGEHDLRGSALARREASASAPSERSDPSMPTMILDTMPPRGLRAFATDGKRYSIDRHRERPVDAVRSWPSSPLRKVIQRVLDGRDHSFDGLVRADDHVPVRQHLVQRLPIGELVMQHLERRVGDVDGMLGASPDPALEHRGGRPALDEHDALGRI